MATGIYTRFNYLDELNKMWIYLLTNSLVWLFVMCVLEFRHQRILRKEIPYKLVEESMDR